MKLLKFHANWCQPCKILSSTLGSVDHPLMGFLENVNIDKPENKELLVKYGLRSIPAMVVVSDSGDLVDTLRGTQSKDEVLNFLNKNWNWGA